MFHLNEDQDDHVAEESYSEYYHGQELAEEVKVGAEVERVDALEADTEDHLSDAEDHGPESGADLMRV